MSAEVRPIPQPREREVFDADAARAARLEAAGADFRFRWAGEEFTIPPAKEWPMDVTSVLSTGDISAAMALLLGDQYEAFKAGRPALADVQAILTAVAKDSGVTLPQ